MTRPITEDDLHAYVDQALDQARQEEVETYLATNPDVARRVAGYGRDRDALRAALAPVASEPIPPELNLIGLMTARRNRFATWKRAAAVALYIGIGGLGGWSLHSLAQPSAGIAALAQEAATSYAVYAPDARRPVEMVAAQRIELVSWASQRLGYPVAVPDLSSAGFRFLGGRLIATEHGPGLLLMFDNGKGTRLAMLTRAMAIDRNTTMKQGGDGPAASFTWAQNGVGYSVVAPLKPAVLHPLADEVRSQMRAL
jgi:anti-sigma factor RsiW